jgi:DNA-binding transcriptional regulator YhcF (GntR family)
VVLQLKEAGWLNARPGIGMVVTEPEQAGVEQRLAQITPHCRALLHEAAELNLTLHQVIDHLKTLQIAP